MSITDALVAEHAVLHDLFGRIERILPKLDRLAEVHRWARLVEDMLQDHGGLEEDLVLVALDHEPEHRGRANHFHREHLEIDAALTQALAARQLPAARRMLLSALRASREHFRQEENILFPVLERVMPRERLLRLGRMWKNQRQRHGPAPVGGSARARDERPPAVGKDAE